MTEFKLKFEIEESKLQSDVEAVLAARMETLVYPKVK